MRKNGKLSLRICLVVLLFFVLPSFLLSRYTAATFEENTQEEISSHVIQRFQHSKVELDSTFKKMINIATIFIYSEPIAKAFSDTSSRDYYEKYKAFASTVSAIDMQNLYENMLDSISLVFFDNNGDWYANREMSSEDADALSTEKWVKESKNRGGFAIWSANGKAVSYACLVINPNQPGSSYGTLVASIDQIFLYEILAGYKGESSDEVFASYGDELLLYDSEKGNKALYKQLIDKEASMEEGHEVFSHQEKEFLVSYFPVGPSGLLSRLSLKIFFVSDYQHIRTQALAMTRKSNLLTILFFLFSMALAIFIALSIGRPIHNLSLQLESYHVGQVPSVGKAINRKDEIGEISKSFQSMAEDNNKLFQNLKEEHVQKEHYYYESLNAKLNPHFLFNTLNSIRWMAVIRKADNIRNCIDALAIILQYHLVDEGKEVPLSKECEIIKNYCYIQNIRYGNRCTLTLDISPLLEQTSIIKFILQPLVENCFKHAFPSTQMDCAIIITAQKEADLLAITVTDNGVGFSPKSLGLFADRQSDTSKKGGIGLLLIDSLIKSYYGGTYGLTIANLPHGSQVKIVVPLKEKKA